MKRIALVGMPNTGKSALFNRITGASARTGNWPGVTVDLMSARILLGADMAEMVDLPGIYNMHGYSDDEQVVRHFLKHAPLDLVVAVVNAAQLDRQLSFILQLSELRLPMVVFLNMCDEAQHLGIKIDIDKLERILNCPFIRTSAKYGHGIQRGLELVKERLTYGKRQLASSIGFDHEADFEIRMEKLIDDAVVVPITMTDGLTRRMDRVLLHSTFGLPLFFFAMYCLFQLVYALGTPLQDGMAVLLEFAKSEWLVPAFASTNAVLRSFLLTGIYDGIGTVLSFLPIILLFFIFMGIVENSGYLSRTAFLMDAFMSRLGLDGRTFVMQLMGLGCNVPALMGTRIMRSRGLRLLTMLIIPFSLCSARLQVFVFLTTAIFTPSAAPVVLFSLYLVSFVAAFLTAAMYRKRLPSTEMLLLELPPYRFPTLTQLFTDAWREARHFVRGAGGFILLGVIAVWFLTHYPFGATNVGGATLAHYLMQWLSPLLEPIGVDQLMSLALVFGFIAKEVVIGALAVIYATGEQSLSGLIAERYTWIQAYSFMLFILIYTPCLSTVAVLRRESKSWQFTLFAVVWPLFLAWLVSFVFYQIASFLAHL